MFQIFKTHGHKGRPNPFEEVWNQANGKGNDYQIYLVPRLCLKIIDGVGQEMRMYGQVCKSYGITPKPLAEEIIAAQVGMIPSPPGIQQEKKARQS